LIVQLDAHRNPLHDLCEVAGGVLRRNDAENSACCRG